VRSYVPTDDVAEASLT